MKAVYIGTSGWSYKSWQANFYPSKLPAGDHLHFYATQFPTVEINLTFYRLPTLKMVKKWCDTAPKGFVFAVKGSRFITHIKKLTSLDGALTKYFDRLAPLKEKVGVILWQLPPFLKCDLERLETFLELLPRSYEHAIEFRHQSWMQPRTFNLMRRFGTALVSVSSQRMPMNLTVTSQIIYIRFHGLTEGAAHDYTRRELEPWVDHIHEQARCGRKAFVYFNNDANERAPANAKLLTQLLQDQAPEKVVCPQRLKHPINAS